MGAVEYFVGYAWTVYDCDTCGCRFTRHDENVFALMHRFGATAYYRQYGELSAECRRCFERRDAEGLRRVLCRTSKYRFVIDRARHDGLPVKMLEVGCSRGYLTSYFILEGRDIIGIDVSSDVIVEAREAFGDRFALGEPTAVAAAGSLDVLYHVGLIGCVADPIGLTKQLLALLKPGGQLLFNAPNRAALHLRGQLWLDSAPPPDLVTLFPKNFWTNHFSDRAEVIENVETLPARNAVAVAFRKLCGRRWQPPLGQPLSAASNGHTWPQPVGKTWRLLERTLVKAANSSGLWRLAAPAPSEFGLFVEMVAR